MKTYNYDLFQINELNRKILKGQIENLKISIEKIGYLKYNPVIVDKEFNIIDGQHRFIACKELGLPIFYEIEKGNADEIMIELNANQKSWSLADYIDHYAAQGKEWFIYFNYIRDKYHFNQSTTLALLVPHQGNSGKLIKEGKGFEVKDNVDYIAIKILEFSEYLDFAQTRNFVKALLRLDQKGTKKDMVKIMDKALLIKKQVGIIDYCNIFENLLNRGRKPVNHISL